MKSVAGCRLDSPVQYLRGVGPRRAALLDRIGVRTVGDLLRLAPRRYIDRSRMTRIADLLPGDEATVIARIVGVDVRRKRDFRTAVSLLVRDASATMVAVWFNRPDLKERFSVGQEILLSGRVSLYHSKQFVNPLFEVVRPGSDFAFENAIIPVYPLTAGLSLWTVRRAIKSALSGCVNLDDETLTELQIQKYGFPASGEAYQMLHMPRSLSEAERARCRLVYEELLYLQLMLALRRQRAVRNVKVSPLPETGRLTRAFRASLPFRLTTGQEQVLKEILADMASAGCMNRLLQGDVGSGKTVVALMAMLVAAENDCQAALMAPTEILAWQHYNSWREPLTTVGARVALLTGSIRGPQRRRILAGLKSGEIQLVFGTHALIEGDVQFHRLGLVVVDEQHRFGVQQRSLLLGKGRNPDFLVMTATPIPRTLALTLYGDLDVSILAEKPPGRKAVLTRLIPEERRSEVYEAVRRRLVEGEQAFVICPVIEQTEREDLASAVRVYEELRRIFAEWKVGLVHGRLSTEERRRLMEDFRSGLLNVLVATSVVEVGVDVPRATLMIVEHPERFGLAQLHQFRGRIGRSDRQSYCLLIVPRDTDDVLERLRFFALTTDGFRLAEKDMELRGPGELLGTRQHGLPDLRIADVVRDRVWLERARDDAFELVRTDPQLARAEHGVLRRNLAERFDSGLSLVSVG